MRSMEWMAEQQEMGYGSRVSQAVKTVKKAEAGRAREVVEPEQNCKAMKLYYNGENQHSL